MTKFKPHLVLAVVLSMAPIAGAGEWESIADAEELRELVSNSRLIGKLAGKANWVTEFCEDGTGTQWAWGTKFFRSWEIRGNDQFCVTPEDTSLPTCSTVERNTDTPGTYRIHNVASGETWVFRVSEYPARSCDEARAAAAPPAPAKVSKDAPGPSAAEMAKKLANPSLAIGQMSSNFVVDSFGGELPGAGDQTSFQYQFQPVLPFPMKNGKSIMFRPLIALPFDKPVFDSESGSFESSGFGFADMPFDLIYGGTSKKGTIFSYGVVGSFPTATKDDLGSDEWRLGPEVLFGKVFKWGLLGALVSHQWDVAGGDGEGTSITGGQYFYGINLGGGTFITAGPAWSYNHNAPSGDKWTFPIGFGVSKTAVGGGRVWKFAAQYWYYLATPDTFGPRSHIRFTVTPVVELPWGRKEQ